MSNITFTNLPVATSLTGSEILAAVQNGTSVRFTISQLATIIETAAGSNTQVQFNNNGVLGASANFTFNGTILKVPVLTATSGIYGGSF
jgi:hypothetical protein